jgi:hypothetical protein
VQVCGQALACMLTVIRRRTAHLIDPDVKGWAAAVRVSVKRQDSAGRVPVARPILARTVNDG